MNSTQDKMLKKFIQEDLLKYLAIFGILLIFPSLFLEWHTVLVEIDNKLPSITQYRYPIQDNYLYFLFLLIGLATISLYILLVKDVACSRHPEKLLPYSYLLLSLLMIQGFLIAYFPIKFLVYEHGLYFPFMEQVKINFLTGEQIVYREYIGIGYMLMIASMVLEVPYFLHYHLVARTFKGTNQQPARTADSEDGFNENTDYSLNQELDVDSLLLKQKAIHENNKHFAMKKNNNFSEMMTHE